MRCTSPSNHLARVFCSIGMQKPCSISCVDARHTSGFFCGIGYSRTPLCTLVSSHAFTPVVVGQWKCGTEMTSCATWKSVLYEHGSRPISQLTLYSSAVPVDEVPSELQLDLWSSWKSSGRFRLRRLAKHSVFSVWSRPFQKQPFTVDVVSWMNVSVQYWQRPTGTWRDDISMQRPPSFGRHTQCFTKSLEMSELSPSRDKGSKRLEKFSC